MVYAIDALRVLAILAVLLIHTSSRTLEASHFNLIGFPFAVFLNQIARFAVPLFFMISGFVLELNADHHKSYWEYLKKRLGKIAIPYVFWSLIYWLFIYTNHNGNFGQALLFGSSSYQLYFIPSLLIFYLVFPILHRIYNLLSNKWVLIILGLGEAVILYLGYYRHVAISLFPVAIVVFNYFVFVLGMVASHNQEKILALVKRWRITLTVITILLGVFVFIEGRQNYLTTYNYEAIYTQWRPSVMLYVICLFGLLFFLFSQMKRGVGFVRTLSKSSFLVFFIHVLILEKVWLVIGKYYTTPLFDLVFFVLVGGLSFGIAYLIHKIPYLYKLTG